MKRSVHSPISSLMTKILRISMWVAMTAFATAASAQSDSAARPVVVIRLIAADNSAEGAPMVLYLSGRRNIIAVDLKKATPEDLAAAIAQVNAIRARYSTGLPADLKAISKGPSEGRGSKPSAPPSPRMAFNLKRLAEAEHSDVPGFGSVRAIDIVEFATVPKAQRGRGRTP
jgi:hypothetical protein